MKVGDIVRIKRRKHRYKVTEMVGHLTFIGCTVGTKRARYERFGYWQIEKHEDFLTQVYKAKNGDNL